MLYCAVWPLNQLPMGHVTTLTTAQGPKVIDKCESERYLHSSFTSEYTFLSSWDLTSANFKLFNTLKLQSSSEPILYLLVSSDINHELMNCVTVFWKVWGQQRATNELCGSCLKEMMVLMTGVCLYYQQWLIYAIVSFAWGKVQQTECVVIVWKKWWFLWLGLFVCIMHYTCNLPFAETACSKVMIRCYQRCIVNTPLWWSDQN